MDIDDELDINLRDSDDVGARIILLTALSVWPEIDDRNERSMWDDWMALQGLMAVATPTEHDILTGPSGLDMDEAAADICDRALDSLPVLAWATALSDEMAFPNLEPGTGDLSEHIPIPDERIEPFLDQLLLRDEDAVALERERAEIWNWRLASESLRRTSSGAELAEIQEAIREVIMESAISLALDEIDLEDFLVDGVPVAKLHDEHLESLIVTSEERLRALNWLCGLTEWDSVHPPE